MNHVIQIRKNKIVVLWLQDESWTWETESCCNLETGVFCKASWVKCLHLLP